jgi:Xaa-Pro aminopeptidase
MVVVCARRYGLVANLTRWVRFGASTAEEDDAEARILEVEADAFAATRPGSRLADVLETMRLAYPRHGFAEDEWLGHHQGGSAGFGTRETLATPGSTTEVALGQAFAWNPTAPGVKVEDTVLVTADDVDSLTVDPRWPTTLARGRRRPAVLQR